MPTGVGPSVPKITVWGYLYPSSKFLDYLCPNVSKGRFVPRGMGPSEPRSLDLLCPMSFARFARSAYSVGYYLLIPVFVAVLLNFCLLVFVFRCVPASLKCGKTSSPQSSSICNPLHPC